MNKQRKSFHTPRVRLDICLCCSETCNSLRLFWLSFLKPFLMFNSSSLVLSIHNCKVYCLLLYLLFSLSVRNVISQFFLEQKDLGQLLPFWFVLSTVRVWIFNNDCARTRLTCNFGYSLPIPVKPRRKLTKLSLWGRSKTVLKFYFLFVLAILIFNMKLKFS